MASNDVPLLPPARSDSNFPIDQLSPDANTVMDDGSDNGLTKVAIGVLVGATLGGVAGALANPGVVDRINQTIKGLGDAIKKAAANVNDNVHNVGDAVYNVSENVNSTVKDVGSAVKGAADEINSTVKDTLNTVRHTAEDVNGTVKDTINEVKDKTGENATQTKESSGVAVNASENGTLYKLIPVNPGEKSTDS